MEPLLVFKVILFFLAYMEVTLWIMAFINRHPILQDAARRMIGTIKSWGVPEGDEIVKMLEEVLAKHENGKYGTFRAWKEMYPARWREHQLRKKLFGPRRYQWFWKTVNVIHRFHWIPVVGMGDKPRQLQALC